MSICRTHDSSANSLYMIDTMPFPSRKLHFAAMASVLSTGLLIPCASAAQTFELDSTKGLQPHDVTVQAVTYHGRKAIRILPAVNADAELVAPKNGEGGGIVVLPRTSFHNGAILLDVAGKPQPRTPSH